MTVTASYRLISQNLDRSLETAAQQAPVQLESEYYLENIASVSTIDEFVADTRLFRFAMVAFGLSDLAYAKGYMRKILEEGIQETDALANRTNDNRIKEFAEAFDFDSFGEATTQRAATVNEVVDRYVRQTLEVDAGERDGEGVRLALYFERQAPEITSYYEILADSALFEVVRTVLGLPDAFAAVDVDRQADVIAERIDLATFTDPEELSRFLTRFTAIWDTTVETASNPVLGLFAGGSTTPSISLDLVMSLQSLRLGGA